MDSPSAVGCGESCLNRMMKMECSASRCPCGAQCSNRQFSMAQYPRLEVFRTEKKGWGLRALQDIPKFVLAWIDCLLPATREPGSAKYE